jgi:predicted acetylornithine/succinylornithine family transaminase
LTSQEIIKLSNSYLMHTYNRFPIALVKGKGVKVWDANGKEYLDFTAGLAVCSLGHCHPVVVEALCRQAKELIHVSNLYYIQPQAKLAALIVQNFKGAQVFFCNSGAEANEAALKLARKYAKVNGQPERYEVITALKSFHGRTLATLAATGQPKHQQGFEPLPPGFFHVPFNDLKALEEAINDKTGAVMLEPVQGESGVYPATKDYLAGVRELCHRHKLALIFDEVQCGLGRTGKFLAFQHYGVAPDIFTLAKGLGSGFPIGAMVAKEEFALAFQPGNHASTFGGNPLACAVGLAVLEYILNHGLIEHVTLAGDYFKEQLTLLAQRFPFIREVRGMGLMLALELNQDQNGPEIVRRCMEQGLLINGIEQHILRFLPPLIVTQQEIDQAVNILNQVFLEKADLT